MIQKVFLDTNVVLDFLVKRPPFSEEAKQLFHMKEDGEIELFVSTLSFGIASYFIEKSKEDAASLLSKLLKLVEVIDLNKKVIEQAAQSGFADYEDAIQYFSAKQARGIDILITRNERDFKRSSIPVMTPSAFLRISNHEIAIKMLNTPTE